MNEKKLFAIIGAMTEEVEAVLRLMEEHERVENAPFELYRGRLGGCEVLVCRSGIGKAEAASTTAYLLTAYEVAAVLNVGSAGGLREDQEPGDIVIATELTYYDLLFDPQDPRRGLEPYTFSISRAVVESLAHVLKEQGLRYHTGLIATGDQFVCSPDQVALVQSRCPGAIACEMESCAVAHTARRFGVPALILRSLSDIACKPGNAVDFDLYIRHASEKSAHTCLLWLKEFADSNIQQ